MSNISPSPTFDVADTNSMWSAAFDMPESLLKSFAWSADNVLLQTNSAGTAIRGATTPAGNEPPPIATGNVILDAINAPAAIRAGIEGIGRWTTGVQNPPMSKADYERSPYFRTAVPWDPGMTEDRAAALASGVDIKTAKDFFASKNPAAYLLGSFVGQAVDPLNYVPIFGEAAQAAAVAKFGINALAKFGIRAGFGAAEAAGNTALFGAATASERARYGDDVSWEAQVNSIAMAAVIGGILTPVVHGLGASVGLLTRDRVEASVQAKMETVENVGVARSVVNDAITSLATEGEVRLSPASGAALERFGADATAKRDMALSDRAPLTEQDIARVFPGIDEVTPKLSLRDATNWYTEIGYAQINKWAREGAFPEGVSFADRQQSSAAIRTLVSEAKPLEKDTEVFRGRSAQDPETGFRSVTTDRRIAESHASKTGDGQVDELTLPKGTPVIKVRGGAEKEIIVIPHVARDGTLMDAAGPAAPKVEQPIKAAAASAPELSVHLAASTDLTPPRPRAVPEGLGDAAGRMAKADDIRAIAAQHGVSEDGSFIEQMDIDQMREAGQLTAEDERALLAADDAAKEAALYGQSLIAAANCVSRML